MLRGAAAGLNDSRFLRAPAMKDHSSHSESPTRTSQYSRRSNSNDDILGGSEESSSHEKQTRKVNLAEHLNDAPEAEKKPNGQESSATPWCAPWDTDVVTVMIRQVPREYTQILFLSELVGRGFEGLFDFIYFPFDLKKNSNIGYGFINFVDPRHAVRFAQEFDYVYLDDKMRAKGKPLRVHAASVQGYQDNREHFSAKVAQKQSPLRSPLFFPGGSLAELPEEVASALADLRWGPEAAAPDAADAGARGEGAGPPASLVEAISSAFAMKHWTPAAAPRVRALQGGLGEAADQRAPPPPPPPAEWSSAALLAEGYSLEPVGMADEHHLSLAAQLPLPPAALGAPPMQLPEAALAEPLRLPTDGLYGSHYAAALVPDDWPFHALSGQFNTLEERRNQLLMELAVVQEEQRRTLVSQLLPGAGYSAGMMQHPMQPPGLL